MTFPVNLMDAGSSANFPIDADAGVYFLEKRPNLGVKDVDETRYEEGIYVGYRWFDKQNIPVSYPFGYGLSYTTFGYSDAAATLADGVVKVNVKVTNTGSVAGKEAVQVYISAPAGKLDKPVKELKGFAKTRKLAPGESQNVEISFAAADMSSYDESKPGWVLDPGTYNILVGASSADIRATASVEVK